MDAIRRSAVQVFSIVAMIFLAAQPAHALVFGGRREPQKHDIWPAGAFRLINLESRVAWCVGPSLSMPNHFEYQGDAAALNAALKLLVAVEGPRPHVVVSDGRASSRWIQPGKDGLPTYVDWTFDICQKETLDGAKPAAPPKPVVSSPWSREKSPAPAFRIYLGNGLDWSKVVIPEGLDITDERLVANGFRPEDSSVVDLFVEDSKTGARLAGAELLIERCTNVTPADAADLEVTRAESNSEGRILLRMLPREPVKLTLSKAGFATRSLGIVNLREASLVKRTVQLSPAHRVSGRVIDDNGTAVMNARVALLPVVGDDGVIYEQPKRTPIETAADGGFAFD
ncbi:MAG TPA: carboxypeptidase-like regulatory domain-containing protein, partial [Caulifigura sp.]|nr:carboxypeptidase-like regulatory domain-containing protein [Caulifigura sp.]